MHFWLCSPKQQQGTNLPIPGRKDKDTIAVQQKRLKRRQKVTKARQIMVSKDVISHIGRNL